MINWTIDVTMSQDSIALLRCCNSIGIYRVCITSQDISGCKATFNITSTKFFKEITLLSMLSGMDGEELDIILTNSYTPAVVYNSKKPIPNHNLMYMIDIQKY